MDISMESTILQELVHASKYIPMFIDEPVSVAITNTKSFIFNQPCAEIPLKCEIGAPFKPDSTPLLVIESKKKIVREVGAHVYGVPFLSYAIPLWEGDRVVGCLMIAKSIERINGAKDAVSTLATEIAQVSRSVTAITSEIQTVSENNQQIYELMTRLLDETAKMNSILSVINKLSNSSKMLSLNASIEAARAGAAGKGFSVVAKEIERMSNNTTTSAHEIGIMLGGVDEQVNNVSEKSRETASSVTQQAAALQQIAATMENLNTNVKVLESYIKKL